MPGRSFPHNANGRVWHLDCAPAASVATPVRGEGVTWTFIIAIRSRVDLCAVAGLVDRRLRQHRRCDEVREDGLSKELEGQHWLCSFNVMHGDCARRLSVGYGAPPPRLEASGRLNPGDGIHLGCRSTGPLITFIELELR